MDTLTDPFLRLALSLGWAAYLLALSVWIVLQKRPPLSTLAWILGLAALPVLGFVVYFFLGPQRIRRQRLRRLRLKQIHKLSGPIERRAIDDLSARHRQLARLIQGSTDAPVSSAATVELLVGGARCFESIIAAIAQAVQHVHMEYYIYEPDAVGTRIRDALVECARSGVKVRLLLDAVGSARLSRGFLAPLRAAGAQVVFFHPLRLATLRPLLNLRSHRKIVVIDGRVGFTGGINITAEEDEQCTPVAFHDLHLRLVGPVVGWLQAVFAEDWLYTTRRPLAEHELYPAQRAGSYPVQVIASGPDTPWESIHLAQVQAIAEARKRVWLVTPYFVPGEHALQALKAAALRGIDTRLLVPLDSDGRIVTWAARSYFDELMEAGVRIYEYLPRMLHSKVLLIDSDCAVLGTANFDHRSFRLNFEVAVAIYSSAFVEPLLQQLRRDFKGARRVPRPRKISLWEQLCEALARLLSPLL